MDSKIVVFLGIMSAVGASVIAPVAPAVRLDPAPQYSFGYDVQDALTGDYKGHQEHRNGDLVTGSYTVVDPDGTRRIVDYAADPINGFNAVVRREPLFAAAPVVPAPVVAPARIAAPAPFVAPAPAPVVAPAPFAAPARLVAPAPYVAPAPFYPRAPIYAPSAPAPLFAPRLPSPYYF